MHYAGRLRARCRERIVRAISPVPLLDEGSLAGELDVERAVVREALACLERDNFTRTEGDGGFSVAPLDELELRELYPVVLLLEGLAVRSAPAFEAQRVASLREINDRMVGAIEDSMTAANVRAGSSTRSSCAASATISLLDTLRPLKRQLLRYEFAYRDDRDNGRPLAHQHAAIADALEHGETKRRRSSSRRTPRGAAGDAGALGARDRAGSAHPIRHMRPPWRPPAGSPRRRRLPEREAEHADPWRRRRTRAQRRSRHARPDADAAGAGRRRTSAHERHDRLAAAQVGEDREGVACHGRCDRRGAAHTPPSATPISPAARPFARRPRRRPRVVGARAAPGRSGPVASRPWRYRSHPVAARDEQAERIEPSR